MIDAVQRARAPQSRLLGTAPAQPHTVQIDTLDVPSVWQQGYDGKGVGIAIIDSGVHAHPDVAKRLAVFKDFVHGNNAQPYDDNGHGTACATLAAGDGTASNGKNMGTAPGATVLGLKAIGQDGYAWSSNVIKAVQWAIENKERYNIRVMSMSFFLDDPVVEAHKPVVDAIKKASEAGIIPVAAACNDGPDHGMLHTIASYPFVVTVAAADTNDTVDPSDDAIADFSSRGPGDHGEYKPDVTAPGVQVTVGTVHDGYKRGSGTSFATPMAAGVIATWVQANPKLNVADVQKIIASTSKPIEGYEHIDQGYGMINPAEGLKMALGMKEQPAA
jgi:serine protease AprX